MKTLIYIITGVFFLLTACTTTQTKDNCNNRVYYSIDSALNCGSDPKYYKSFLFALVSKDMESNKKLGWDILKDKDIIEIAKRDYVLIIIDPSDIKLNHDSIPNEFADIIKQKREDTYFVVTNRVFYPFRQFYLSENKERIINELGLGEGP
ncbi:MAG: hypothetical protein V4620_04430 [Bacteroidota bacterium]